MEITYTKYGDIYLPELKGLESQTGIQAPFFGAEQALINPQFNWGLGKKTLVYGRENLLC